MCHVAATWHTYYNSVGSTKNYTSVQTYPRLIQPNDRETVIEGEMSSCPVLFENLDTILQFTVMYCNYRLHLCDMSFIISHQCYKIEKEIKHNN